MKILNKPRRALPPPHVVELIDKLADTPNEYLAELLGRIESWKWPRSDLNAWVKVLNKFDAILEEAIRDYDIDKMQMNPFTPSTKKLICEVLRFERLLLENSTNRKTFNSYDRLNSLMATSDIDVLTYALNLLLRPAQQYSAQPQVSHALNISTPRLTSLAKRWPNLHDFDVKLTALASKSTQSQIDSLPNEAREVVFTFYRKDATPKEKTADADVFDAPAQTPRKSSASSSAASTSSGSVVVHIDSQTLETKGAMEILADTVETYSVPDEEKFELLCRIRTAQALTKVHADDREKLVIVRLLATAIFSHTHVESTAFSSLFLYEPDLVQHIAELLQLDAGIDVHVQTAAIAALDAIGRYRNKVQDVLTAVNAGVNHGILMALTRKTVGEIANAESNIPQPFVEGLVSFVTYIATHASGGNMVVSAGLIPLLIQVIEVRLPSRLYAISKTMQLLDNVLYGYTNAFQLFCNARGVETLVERIEHEVDLDLEEWGPGKIASDVSVIHGKISVARSAVLKHTLRSMHRMMQSSGTSEGLRGLLDSTLLKSAKKIMDNGDVFGPSILAIAINIMATFVHNEPTCLGVIQENGLPESFYRVVESGLEPAIEVIQAIPNAIGALCLNQAGQEQLAARPSIIPSLFSIFVSERHQRILQEKENAVLIGTAIEELIRHHPTLKDAVFDAIKTTLTKIEELGNAFEAQDDMRQYYNFLVVRPTEGPVIGEDRDIDMDRDSNAQTARSATPVRLADTDGDVNMPSAEDASAKSHENVVVSYIDVFGKFLEGYFQHVPHCRDFISSTDGLERIGRLTALPCLPYDFPNSVASDSLVQVVRTMVEAATSETLTFLVKLVNESLAETKHLREGDMGQSKLLALTRATESEIVEANKDLRRLITLEVRVMLLSDIYSTAGYAQGRASATLLQALTGPEASNLVLELGSLHRSCLWENILLINADEPKKNDITSPSSEDLLQLGDGLVATTSTSAIVPVVEANGARNLPRPPFVVPSQSEIFPNYTNPRQCNSQVLQHITGQLPRNILQPLFQAVVRLFQTRRILDGAQRQRILESSSILAEVILSHLSPRPSDDTRAVFTYYAAMLSLCSVLLIEERGHIKVANTVLLWAFFRKGGLDAIVALCRSFVHTIEQLSPISPDERSDTGSQELIHAHGGLRVALSLILTIVSAKPILDSPQTMFLQTPEKKSTEPDWFEPHSFIVRMRHTTLPVMREIWDAPWLVSAPLSVSKSVIQVVLELLNIESEEVKESTIDAPSLVNVPMPRPVGPDENRVRQLTDMGFPRSAAERALIRTRNNVTAAADLLLAQPFPLPPDPQPNDNGNDQGTPAEVATIAGENAENVENAENAEAETGADAGSSSQPDAPLEAQPSVAEATVLPPTGKTPEEWRQELESLREPLKDGLGKRALVLVDEHPSLVFDVQRVFIGPSTGYRDQAVRLLLDDIKAFSSAAYDHQEQPMSVRCRLLALVLNEPSSPMSSMTEEESTALVNVLLALLLSNPVNEETRHPTIPKWLASHLLVTEALLTMSEDPSPVTLPKEGEIIPEAKLGFNRMFPEARSAVFDFCMRLLVIPSLPRDELLSSLRLFVLLTRDHTMASEFAKKDGVSLLFRLLRGPEGSANAVGTHPYIAIILRHIVEDPATLHNVMQQEIKHFFSHSRNRLMDVGSFVRNCSAMALRDPNTFVEVVAETCQLSHPYNAMKNISLKELTKPAVAKNAPDTTDTDMQVDSPTPSRPANSSSAESLDNLVHFLIAELIKSVKAEHLTESAGIESKVHSADNQQTPHGDNVTATSSSASPADYTYACFLMQCLTELLFSYDTCKIAFLSYSPKKRFHTPAKDAGHKHRTAALQFLITELMSFGTINPTPPPEAKKQISLCNWAMSVVVALCVDTTPAHDIKDVPPDRVSVRKFVLEAINRAIKELPTSESTEVHYSRLLALADLCYRLLTVRFNTTSRKANEEVPTHLAKVMLEKNFVATLTNALAEVDPNYPNIRGVITGILRPLEYLTKIAIKMSRVSDKHKDSFVEQEESVDSELSEEDEDTDDADREETPDLYRNSSLGMYGGEMEDVHYGPDDEMDEDADEEEDAEMDFDHGDTGSEDTSNTDEEEAGLVEDIENESAGSEEGWHDDEDEDEDLVENDEEHDEDDDDGEDDEDTGNEEVMWQGVAVGDGADGEAAEEIDGDEADEDIPIISAHPEEEGDMLSEADDFADELGVFVPNEGQVPPDIFNLGGFGNPFDAALEGNQRDATQMFWRGMARPTRRHGVVEDDMEIFGRSRTTPTAVPEGSVHPLLLDPSLAAPGGASSSRSARRPPRAVISGFPQDLLHSIEHVIGEGAVQLFQHILSGRNGGETIRIDVPPGGLIPQFGRHGRGGISAHIRLERAPRSGEVRSDGRGFEPLLTMQRWAEEVKTMHGKFEQGRAAKLTNYVVLALLPAAIEALKQARIEEEKEAERRREAKEKAESEEAAKREEEERIREKEKAEAEVAAAAAAEEEARRVAEAQVAAAQQLSDDVDTEMADAEAEAQAEAQAQAEPAADMGANTEATAGASTTPERITVMIHGNAVDITDTGIDPTFLEALPDDMREEVLNQHMRDQRAARTERPVDSQISPEFLDALPPELRAEIIQQETIERDRRRTEPTAEPQGAVAVPSEMDPADFIASLDPQLRQVVLMDSDDVFIQSLPPHMLAEAGIYREAQQAARAPPVPAAGGRRSQPPTSQVHKQPVSREAIQLLDKHAIAVLIRLLFFPQVLKKNILSKVLVNLSENTRTRTDIFNLLLGILQDGTGDLSSIDKSFAQISFRSKPPTQSTPKPVNKATLPQPEVVPELVAQRCLDALAFITSANEASSVFFLSEQELPAGLRRAPSKKGKGKEKQVPQTYYPIVLLLAQLDRQSLLRTPSLMEAIVGLLALVTRPLASLKDSKKKDTAAEDAFAPTAQASQNMQQQGVVDTAANPPSGTSGIISAPASIPVVTTTTAATATATATTTATTTAATPAAGAGSQAPPVEEKVLLAHPPIIPHPILRFVVNILTTGECSGRTFSHTLGLIQHLSFIPGARDVIAQELCVRVQEFGHQLFNALDELATALRESRTDDVAISVASRFSPASSDQAKLLRLLKTIDYMHSPKALNSTAEVPNEDVEHVQGIYEGFRFTTLWRRLGDCLAIIEEQPELEHIATVLLPLIESLMVVCKYVGPKAANAATSRALRAMSPKSPITGRESMEELFVTFTEAHRKVLNLMVRNNPSLMSGSFSLLVNNPRVLDFDNKRNYFNQQVHRRPHTREHYGTLQLNVRRQRVFEDSFQYLQRKTGEQIKYGKLSVRFYDEEGVDAGGVTREWFQILARQMFDPNYCLFQPCAADRLTYQPNKASAINPEHLSFFKFVGRIIGKAIYDGRLLDAYFARSLYRQLLGKPVDYRDVEWVDPEYYKSLCWILENDPSALELTFSVEVDEFGVTKIVELKEGGATIPVTQDNRREFVQLSAQYRLYSSIKEQIEALLTGFYEIIPKDLITIFDEKELELLISGTPDIDVDEWRSATEYNGYTSSDPAIVWFWRALKSFNREERAKVLSFATGTSRVPLGGFVDLQGVQGVQRFSIHRAYGDPDRLPQAHTCFNQIDLPQYSSYEMLRQQILLAIHEGGEGFGFA